MSVKQRLINYRGFILALLTAGLVAGCSVRMTYNYLDWLIPWYVDDYVTLDQQQEQLFDRAMAQLLGWHRTQELPRYSDFLDRLRLQNAEPVSQQQVLDNFDEARQLGKDLLLTAMPVLVELAQSLSDKQVDELITALAKDIRDIEEEESEYSDQERREKWRENMEDALDDWLDDVSSEQTRLVEVWSETRINTYADWIRYRKDWLTRFTSLMAERSQPGFEPLFRQLLLDPQSLRDEAYREDTRQNRRQFAQLLADLSETLSPRQRQHMLDKLDDLVSDLVELSKQRG